jgi:steroid delta-isomerase-like uncharacterized protein
MAATDPLTYVNQIVSAWQDNNPSLLDDLMAEGYVLHADDGTDMGLQDLKAAIRDVRALIPDFEHTVQDAFGQEDAVAYRWTMRGTHTGSLAGFPATGRTIDYQGLTIFHVEDGRIHEEWFGVIGQPLMQQLQNAPPSS